MARFTKEHRLLTKADYSRVFNDAKKIVTSEYLLLFKKNTLENPRLGLAISKKNVKKATERNTYKRVVRETFRDKLDVNVDVVFLSRKGLEQLSKQQLAQHLAKSWEKLNTFCKTH